MPCVVFARHPPFDAAVTARLCPSFIAVSSLRTLQEPNTSPSWMEIIAFNDGLVHVKLSAHMRHTRIPTWGKVKLSRSTEVRLNGG